MNNVFRLLVAENKFGGQIELSYIKFQKKFEMYQN